MHKDVSSFIIQAYCGTDSLREIAESCNTPYFILYTKSNIELGEYALERFVQVARSTDAGLIYSDYYEQQEGKLQLHPVIDYQIGSLRDDFHFGPVFFIHTAKFKKAVSEITTNYLFAALYDIRLRLSLSGEIFRIQEPLYTVRETEEKQTGEKHFAYVDPKNREVQIEMEKACTDHLQRCGAWIAPTTHRIDFNTEDFPVEASVIIPVKNRARTIADAIHSILQQKTDFSFNILVVDNHSTDDTTKILKKLSKSHPNIVHIVPERTDLGIGGCWNTAIMDERCGRFCIQLDSDDLYINEQVLQKIVDTFYQEQTAAVIGSYKLVNFNLEELPPGLIDHKEWTDENGMNNGLRINGFGAPRAYYTPVIREIKFPNTSYGEDYAVVLAISRTFRIGRIYAPLYLCRRWEDNTDASLSIEKENQNNLFKDRIRTMELMARKKVETETKKTSPLQKNNLEEQVFKLFHSQLYEWEMLREKYDELKKIKVRSIPLSKCTLYATFNPARKRSSISKTDIKSIRERPCFLCEKNRPKEQRGIVILDKYEILVNPYPLFEHHFTIPTLEHTDQRLNKERLKDMLTIAAALPSFSIFYNGPKCGASAPDHFHFQAGDRHRMPVEEEKEKNPEILFESDTFQIKAKADGVRRYITIEGEDKKRILDSITTIIRFIGRYVPNDPEPMINIIVFYENRKWNVSIFPRTGHRPSQFFEEGEKQLVFSPGVVDFGGFLTFPFEEDFEIITPELLKDMFSQLTIGTNEFRQLKQNIKNLYP
ncbi:DUF4922 domain-containing protein [Porphyromonadaceae bacterium OttesenSCG-928-L07]|nr:DUF4922 domain-containing protein [Porphyromonadaceae bacterium OttesenSCG-928-L07]